MARILAIDDSVHVTGLIKDILVTRKHTVETASSGIEGLEKYGSFKPDLVLLDLAMPEMDGTEVLRKMIASDRNANIIVVSAVGSRELLEECMQNGAIGYIEKPFSVKHLASVVGSVVAEKERPRVFATISAATARLERKVQEVLGSGTLVRLAGISLGTQDGNPEFRSKYAKELAMHLQKDTAGFYSRFEGDVNGVIISFAREDVIDILLGDVLAERAPDRHKVATDFFGMANSKLLSEVASLKKMSLKILPAEFHVNEAQDEFWGNLTAGYGRMCSASFDVLYNDVPAEWETRVWSDRAVC